MERRPLVAALTLGCKLNQAETQAAARRLQDAGCTTLDRPAQADAYLINTCTITRTADRKARRLIRMARKLSPSAPIVVTGCYAEREGERLAAELGVQVVGNRDKDVVHEAVLSALEPLELTAAPAAGPAAGRTRAFIKIQEGCDDVCAFCIVPQVRGRERARSIESIVAAVRERRAEGVEEVVLTGTQPGAYGRDRDDGTSAARLLEALLAETDVPRIRYSSIQPQDVTPQLLACWEDARMCRHFHLALQSGSDAVLPRMRRRYTSSEFLSALEQIRAAAPGAAITTDVIAGFPGETEADHRATLALAQDAGFADMHVFPYSSRPRTSAGLMADDVPPPLKQSRARELRVLARRQAVEFRSQLIGQTASVLFETDRRGLTDTYAPVELEAAEAAVRNRTLAVRLVGLAEDAETDMAGSAPPLRGVALR